MKLKIVLLSALIFAGCSNKSPESLLPVSPVIEESNQSLITERIAKAKNEYTKSLKSFTDSKEKKLQERNQLFLDFKDRAQLYKALLASTENNAEVSSIISELVKQTNEHQLILTDIKKFNDSKISIEESNKELNEISSLTDEFILTKITELDLRDSLLKNISEHKNSSRFLILSFQNELTEDEIQALEDRIQDLEKVESIFAPFFTYKNVLDQSKQSLKKVDFSFLKEDHTVAALTHEDAFFKSLDQHLDSLETFEKDASIYLGNSDLNNLKLQRKKINSTLESVSQIKIFQEEMAQDRAKIRLIGYDFPKNIETIAEDNLKWQPKKIFLSRLFDHQGKWSLGYHIVGPRFNAVPTDHITLKNYYYELVNKDSFVHFEKVFGDAYYRLALYAGKYAIPPHVEKKYENQAILILKTYDLVSTYIESL